MTCHSKTYTDTRLVSGVEDEQIGTSFALLKNNDRPMKRFLCYFFGHRFRYFSDTPTVYCSRCKQTFIHEESGINLSNDARHHHPQISESR